MTSEEVGFEPDFPDLPFRRRQLRDPGLRWLRRVLCRGP